MNTLTHTAIWLERSDTGFALFSFVMFAAMLFCFGMAYEGRFA